MKEGMVKLFTVHYSLFTNKVVLYHEMNQGNSLEDDFGVLV